MKTVIRNFALLLLIVQNSCAFHHHTAPTAAAADAQASDPPADVAAVQPSTHVGDPSQIITLRMYRLTVPYGKVSRNSAFWKLIDEDALDLPSYNMLYDNGLRVGRAPASAWPAIQKTIATELMDGAVTGFTSPSGIGSVSLNMSPEEDEETLFILDQHGATGRIYTHCTNQLNFAFMWAPHKSPGTIRMTICPLVLTRRERTDFVWGDDPVDVALKKSENLYDLGLRADIRPGEFLIVGPSPSADDPTRVGNRFLTHAGKFNRREDFLLFSAAPMSIHADLAPATQPSAVAPLH